MWKNVFAWLDERLGLNDLYKNVLDRPEPKVAGGTRSARLVCSYLSCRG